MQLGARYDGSPLIVSDGTPPADSFTTYTPSSVPGGRAPHVWLGNGRGAGDSLYDQLGMGFTLVRLSRDAPDAAPMLAAAARYSIPLTILDVPGDDARDLYGCDLTLIRPDQHVAWRGNRLPDDPDKVLGQVAGWV